MPDRERLTAADLQVFIDKHQIAAEILHLAEDTPTVPDAARVLGVEPDQIIKSLVFLVRDEPLLVIANGARRIDRRKVAAHFDVGQKRVKLAPAERAQGITGYVVGAMPPFGHRARLPTLIDPAVLSQPLIYGGGGEVHAMLKLQPTQLLAVTGAETISILQDETQT